MTLRQQLLKLFYPLLMKFGQMKRSKTNAMESVKNINPPESLYNYSVELNNGSSLPLSAFKGKKLLIVNTASDCGYTPQYAELQSLYERNKDHLQIIGFPSNDFKEQEKRSDAEIAEFCQVNYGVKFPIAKKAVVRSSGDQQQVFQWLTNAEKNGWNTQEPSWNFSKYLIDENGALINIFPPDESPLSDTVLKAINK